MAFEFLPRPGKFFDLTDEFQTSNLTNALVNAFTFGACAKGSDGVDQLEFVKCENGMYMEQFRTKCRVIQTNIIKCYTNPLRLHRYDFRTVNTINVLFPTLHTTPFLYDKILLGVLHLLRVPVLQRPIPHMIRTRHNCRQE